VGFLSALLDAVAPPLCVLCREPPGALPWLCGACADQLALFAGARCLRCGAPRPLPAPVCGACPEDWPARLVAARAAAPHAGTARALVHALKFRRVLAAARPLGYLAAAAARDLNLPRHVVVVPVPLHRRRRRERGFNQATEIARVVARELARPLKPRWLRRIRGASAVVHRTRSGRRRETRGAFRARRDVAGRTILLVDDVLTTGATLASCARALGRRGARAVYAVTATRAPTPR
jgi:ComF family protein